MSTDVPLILSALGTPPLDGERPSALLRFPGACGVRDFMSGALVTLADPDERLAFLATCSLPEILPGAGRFGGLVAFLPAGTPLVKSRREAHVYVALNVPVRREQDVTWAPPRMWTAGTDWGAFRSAAEVREACGPSLPEEKLSMAQQVNAYFEEISQVGRAGIPYPSTPWYATPLEERLTLLGRAGAPARWSAPPSPTASVP